MEFESEDYPDERLIACRNPLIAQINQLQREALLEAAEKELDLIVQATQREKRALKGQDNSNSPKSDYRSLIPLKKGDLNSMCSFHLEKWYKTPAPPSADSQKKMYLPCSPNFSEANSSASNL